MSPRLRAPILTMRTAGILLLVLLIVPLASAHAVLQSADPPPNGHADEGVAIIEIRFTEDIERDFTGADLVDLNGTSWAAGPVEFDPDRHNVIRLPVRPLESGIYSATWRALSADTHTTRGSFVFAIGDASLRPGQYAPVVDTHASGDVARDGFARFAFYLGLFLVIGVPLFALHVMREPEPPRALFRTAASFGLVGAVGAFVGLLFLADRTGLGLASLDTSPGRSFLARGLLLAGGAAACATAALVPSRWRQASFAALALGAASIFATATGSHAAAARDQTAILIAADGVHLAMGAVWIGGIVGFLHVGWGREAHVGAMVDRFSPIAIGSVIALLATGTLASLAHMPCARDLPFGCVEALRTESYVRLVALKLALMAPLILLGALHKYHIGPRLRRGDGSSASFRRLIQTEAVLMVLILGAAGILAASAPPAREVETGEAYLPYVEFQNLTAKSHVILQVEPNPVTVGIQKVVVTVHPLGARLPNGTQVALKVWPAGEKEPELTIEPTKVTPDSWEIEDGLFTSAGEWTLLVILDRGDEYVKIPFAIPVVNPGGPSRS